MGKPDISPGGKTGIQAIVLSLLLPGIPEKKSRKGLSGPRKGRGPAQDPTPF